MLITNFFKKMLAVAMVITLSAAGFALPKNGYVIKGSTKAADGTKVMFYNYQTQALLDSTVVKGGLFVLKGTVEKPFIGYIADGSAQQLIIEPGEIKLVMGDDGRASGTPLNEKLGKYSDEMNSVTAPLYAKANELDSDTSMSDEKKQEAMKVISDQYSKALADFVIPVIKENDNIIGLMYFEQIVASGSDTDLFAKASAVAGDKLKSSESYTKAAKRFETLKNSAEGKMFSDFTITNGKLDGTSVSLSDYVGKGKYILVDFWASWCGPCRAEIPNIKENYAKYAGEKFDIVSVAVWDKRAATLKAIEEEKLPWNQIIDAQQIPSDLYGFNGIPCIMLFAPDGTIYSSSLRGSDIGSTLQTIFNK